MCMFFEQIMFQQNKQISSDIQLWNQEVQFTVILKWNNGPHNTLFPGLIEGRINNCYIVETIFCILFIF